MPPDSVVRTTNDSPDDNVERVLTLLTEALKIVDALDMPPEIGARIQEAIRALEDRSGISLR